jgi:hypothetical protein
MLKKIEQSPEAVYPLKLHSGLTPESDHSKAVIKSRINYLVSFYFEIPQRSKS